jgi:hypothetical protein
MWVSHIIFTTLYIYHVEQVYLLYQNFQYVILFDVVCTLIQLGQALSTRPDILPTVYCQELAKLQVQ